MLVEHLDEFLGTHLVHVELGDNFDAFITLGFYFLPHFGDFLIRSGDDETPAILGARDRAFHEYAQQFFLQEHGAKSDAAEYDHDHTGNRQVENVGDGDQRERGKDATPKQGPKDGGSGRQGRPVIESLPFENERGAGEQDKKELCEIVERGGIREIEFRDDARVRAQEVSDQKAGGKDAGVSDLMNLRSNLLVSSEHRYFCCNGNSN